MEKRFIDSQKIVYYILERKKYESSKCILNLIKIRIAPIPTTVSQIHPLLTESIFGADTSPRVGSIHITYKSEKALSSSAARGRLQDRDRKTTRRLSKAGTCNTK